MIKTKSKITQETSVDMWYGDEFEPKKYYADSYFYPHGSSGWCYRGNIYNDLGETIGDYATNDSVWIESNFKIEWR